MVDIPHSSKGGEWKFWKFLCQTTPLPTGFLKLATTNITSIEEISKFKIQLNETIDISKISPLLYVTYIYKKNILEELLFCHTRGEDIYTRAKADGFLLSEG